MYLAIADEDLLTIYNEIITISHRGGTNALYIGIGEENLVNNTIPS